MKSTLPLVQEQTTSDMKREVVKMLSEQYREATGKSSKMTEGDMPVSEMVYGHKPSYVIQNGYSTKYFAGTIVHRS